MKTYLLIAIALAACSKRVPNEPVQPVPPPPPVAKVARPASTAPSIYELGLTLRDSNDQTIGLDIARGKPVLLTMFYSSCTVACPALIDDVSRTLAQMPAETQVLLVSFDPARDTPARLAELARLRGLDARWTLAAPPDEADVRELAAAIGYKYRKLESGEFFHGATVVLLDEEGRPIARSESLGQRQPLVTALR